MASSNQDDLSAFFSDIFGGLRPPPLPSGFNRESVRKLQVVDTYIPTNTIKHFFNFAFEGDLPGLGRKTALPLIAEDEIPLLVSAYSSWAPAPFSRTPSSLQDRILDAYQKTDRFNAFFTERRISCMRARLWEGMVPMSAGRWKEKKLDEHQNWQFAFEFLYDIILTFMWLGDPANTRGIKENFNFVAEELRICQQALNAKRRENGEAQQVDLRALWLEFMSALFETMVTRTHTWFGDRVPSITLVLGKNMYDSVCDAKGETHLDTKFAAKKFLESWSDLHRLWEKTDWMFMMPLDGFTGFPPSTASFVFDTKVVGTMFPMPFRKDEYDEESAKLEWAVHTRLDRNIQGVYSNRADIEATLKERQENTDTLRKFMRGEPRELGEEHWVSILKSRTQWSLSHGGPEDQTWGFVCYNLTHKSGEEWSSFLSKIEADFAKQGEWVQGFEDVKGKMGLQWLDGKELGFAKDDIQAARTHFHTFKNSPTARRRAWKLDFLVIDSECFSSYTSPPPPLPLLTDRKPHGDHGGYFKLIDTSPYSSKSIEETAPGYKWELRVLGSLVFEDVYPLVASLAQRPRDLWPYACLHPMQVYVGPTVPSQEKEWERIWQIREMGSKTFMKWRREQERRSS
jgi:hypothetical protein